MRVQAGKPFKVTLTGRGKKRVRWQVKFWVRDETSRKLKEIARKTFASRMEAVDQIPRLVRDYEQTQGHIRTGEKMTFADLAEVARQTFYAAATIRNGHTIEGVRSHKPIRTQLKNLEAYFSDYKLTSIRQADISAYRKHREREGSRRGKSKTGTELSVSTLNRELAILRRLLKHAENEGWIVRNPFAGAKLINTSAELERTRILSQTEETLLLAVCEPGLKQVTYRRRKRGTEETQTITATIETGNPELKAAVLLALDCGLRPPYEKRTSFAQSPSISSMSRHVYINENPIIIFILWWLHHFDLTMGGFGCTSLYVADPQYLSGFRIFCG